MILGMTTTYDDADLFSDAFTGFRGVAPTRRHSRLLTALALVAAALLVAAGLVWAWQGGRAPAAVAVEPTRLVPALAQTQRPTDVIADPDRADLLIDPTTTRLLRTEDAASYYVASAAGNQLCLVEVPKGDLAQISCESTKDAPTTVHLDDVMLVPAGATAPSGWHEATANVFVQD